MTGSRWQYLDRKKPEKGAGSAGIPTPAPETAPPDPPSDPEGGASRNGPPETVSDPRFLEAQGYYRLGDSRTAADLLAALLRERPGMGEARRLLGLALGRLGDLRGAAEALSRALAEAPGDEGLRAGLISARIGSGELPELPEGEPAGALGEVAGAAAWLHARERLREDRPGEAAALFRRAGRLFRRASAGVSVGERLAACYVGEAVSCLLAGQDESAQACFSRLLAPGRAGEPAARLPEPVLRFARELFEVAAAVGELSPEERAAVLAPLRDLILHSHLRAGFYDGTRPVALHWEGWTPGGGGPA